MILSLGKKFSAFWNVGKATLWLFLHNHSIILLDEWNHQSSFIEKSLKRGKIQSSKKNVANQPTPPTYPPQKTGFNNALLSETKSLITPTCRRSLSPSALSNCARVVRLATFGVAEDVTPVLGGWAPRKPRTRRWSLSWDPKDRVVGMAYKWGWSQPLTNRDEPPSTNPHPRNRNTP